MKFKLKETDEGKIYKVKLKEKEAAVVASLLGKVMAKDDSEFRDIVTDLWEQGFEDLYGTKYYKIQFPENNNVIHAPLGKL